MASVFHDKAFFDVFFQEGTDAKARLWPYILRFNSHPCHNNSQPSTTFLPGPDLTAWLASLPDSLRQPTEQEQADPVFFWDFSEDSRKLALLDDASLVELAKISGVTLHAQELAQVIEREKYLFLRKQLGENLFDYALVRGQYQAGAAGAIFAKLDGQKSLLQRCQEHGWLALRLCAFSWPVALRSVFEPRLRSLAGVQLSDSEPSVSDGDRNALWRMLKKCLLREVLPAWAQFFTA